MPSSSQGAHPNSGSVRIPVVNSNVLSIAHFGWKTKVSCFPASTRGLPIFLIVVHPPIQISILQTKHDRKVWSSPRACHTNQSFSADIMVSGCNNYSFTFTLKVFLPKTSAILVGETVFVTSADGIAQRLGKENENIPLSEINELLRQKGALKSIG